MENTSRIELSRSALQHNFNFLREKVSAGTLISHVVKGNAYGHGIDEFIPLAQQLGAQHFSVFDAHEAYRVKQSLLAPAGIMIMGMVQDEQLEWIIGQGIEFYVFDLERLEKALTWARKLGKQAKVHIELETGMNRSGFETDKWPYLLQFLSQNQEYLEVAGICTHFAGAENFANHLRIKQQVKQFRKGLSYLKEIKKPNTKLHSSCSAAVLRFPRTHYDMVRVGILQYGLWPSVETFISTEESEQDPLKRVLSWKSRIMNLKTVPKGEYIGYGTSYLATQDMRVAVVPVGYSHGFSRSLSNSGRALVRGVRTAVIGVVNMNVMMLDVSQVPGVERGDEVVLIGTQGASSISVSSFSEFSDQMNYELLCRLPQDIPRIISN